MKNEDKDDKVPEEVIKPMSLIDEARTIREEIIKAKDDLQKENDRKEKLRADKLLSSSAGARVELPQETEEEKKVKGAADYFEGTKLGSDIRKANE